MLNKNSSKNWWNSLQKMKCDENMLKIYKMRRKIKIKIVLKNIKDAKKYWKKMKHTKKSLHCLKK